MLNALSPAERQELEQLRQAFFGQRAVVAVIQAQADLSYLRALQDELRVDAVIMDYIQAQEDALNYLPQVNQAISEWLGIDFAALSAGSG